MKTPRLLVVLTVVNFGMLVHQAVRLPAAQAEGAPAILRGSGIEIVDDQGRLRAQLKVEPAGTHVDSAGTKIAYPETVIFRLITADGKPRVKLTTSDPGSGLMLLGSSDTTRALLKADGATTTLILRNDEAKQRSISP
jgi:hypothetical protein